MWLAALLSGAQEEVVLWLAALLSGAQESARKQEALGGAVLRVAVLSRAQRHYRSQNYLQAQRALRHRHANSLQPREQEALEGAVVWVTALPGAQEH